jgi:hypothetical protein
MHTHYYAAKEVMTIKLPRPHSQTHHIAYTNGHFYHLHIRDADSPTTNTTLNGEQRVNHDIDILNENHTIRHRLDSDVKIIIAIRFDDRREDPTLTTQQHSQRNSHTHNHHNKRTLSRTLTMTAHNSI